MLMRPLLLVVWAACLTAGCAHPAATPAPTSSVAPAGPSHPIDEPIPSLPTSVPPTSRLALSDCSGSEGAADWLGASSPARHPPGWSPSATPGMRVHIAVLECQRIAWSRFERGPVRWVLELHDSFRPASRCMENRTGVAWMVQSLWVSDPEVGSALLHDMRGLPVIEGTIDINATAAPGEREWRWGRAGDPLSLLHTFPDNAADVSADSHRRLFWWDDVGISYMEWSQSSTDQNASGHLVAGTMAPPMLFAAQPEGFFPGTGGSFTSRSATGAMVSFGDFACEQPSPSR